MRWLTATSGSATAISSGVASPSGLIDVAVGASPTTGSVGSIWLAGAGVQATRLNPIKKIKPLPKFVELKELDRTIIPPPFDNWNLTCYSRLIS
jgi:hypothetical protein